MRVLSLSLSRFFLSLSFSYSLSFSLSLSNDARRLINEMKKLRLSLIFNEQALALARIYNGRRSPGPDGPKYHLPAVASHLHAHTHGLVDSRENRANKKFQAVYSCVFSPVKALSYGAARQVRAEARFSFFSARRNISDWLCSKWISCWVSFSLMAETCFHDRCIL